MTRIARSLVLIALLAIALPARAAPPAPVSPAAPAGPLQLDLQLDGAQLAPAGASLRLSLTASVALQGAGVVWQGPPGVVATGDAPQEPVSLPANETVAWSYLVPLSPGTCGAFSLFAFAHTADGAPVNARLHGFLSADGGAYKLLLEPSAAPPLAPLPQASPQGGGGGDAYEPDNGPGDAKVALVGTTYSGHNLTEGDVDWARFTAVAGKTYAIELLSRGCNLDPVLELYESDGLTLIHSEDLRTFILWTATGSGPFFVKVMSGNAVAFGTWSTYSLRITALANAPDAYESIDSWATAKVAALGTSYKRTFHTVGDVDQFRIKVVADRFYAVDILSPGPYAKAQMALLTDGDTPVGYGYRRITWRANYTGYFHVRITNDPAYTSGDLFGPKASYYFRASSFAPVADAFEYDGTQGAAKVATLGVTYRHSTSAPADQDWMKFYATAGTSYAIDLPRWGKYAEYRWELFLYQSDGITEIGHAWEGGLSFTPSSDGWYYLQMVHDDSAPFGPGSDYDIRVTGPDHFEPDGAYSAATFLPLGALSPPHNMHPGNEQDWFAFYATAGKSYIVSVPKHEPEMLPDLAIFDPSGVTPLLTNHPRLVWRAPSTAVYYVRVRNAKNHAYLSSYRLLLQAFTPALDAFEPDDNTPHARPMAFGTVYKHNASKAVDNDYMRFEVSAGTSYAIHLRSAGAYATPVLEVSNVLGNLVFNETFGAPADVGWTAPEGDLIYLHMWNYKDVYFGPGTDYTIQVSKYAPNPDAYEGDQGDNDAAHAQLITLGIRQPHTFHRSYDEDWVRVSLTAGHPYRFETVNLACGNDTIIFLYDQDGAAELASNDDGGFAHGSRIEWTPGASHTYFLRIVAYGGLRFGPGTQYEVRITDLLL